MSVGWRQLCHESLVSCLIGHQISLKRVPQSYVVDLVTARMGSGQAADAYLPSRFTIALAQFGSSYGPAWHVA